MGWHGAGSPTIPNNCRTWWLVWLLVLACCGCTVIQTNSSAGKSRLAPLRKAPEQIDLDVVFVRIPTGDQETVANLWRDVDELAVPAAVRRQLLQNGFRVGVIGSDLPPELADVLQKAQGVEANGEATLSSAEVGQLGATQRRMYLRKGQRGDLVVTSVKPELHVLHAQHGELQGETYRDAQPQFSVAAERTDDGRVQLSLIPEVHHGQFHQRYVPGEGMFRLDSSRKKKIFARLEIRAALATGQIMMLGGCSSKKGSLGHRFFAEVSEDRDTDKLLLVRVGETSFRSLFASAANSDRDTVE